MQINISINTFKIYLANIYSIDKNKYIKQAVHTDFADSMQ